MASGAGGGAGAGGDGGSVGTSEDVGVQFTIDGWCSTKHRRVRSLDAASLSPTTLANTTKEELCLEYVENFQKQFAELFPSRAPPFLVAPNEAGVMKFLSTTLRCSQLPYKQLYGLQECATFFAHYLTYEPLADPLRVPEVLPSPSVVLSWRIGDSFDLSFVLCSFLLGNGFDAYVVVGKAPRWITLRDQRRRQCPFTVPRIKADEPTKLDEREGGDDGDDDDDDSDAEMHSKYVPGDKGVPQSKYLAAMAKRAKQGGGDGKRDGDSDGEEELEPTEDPLAGRRVHAWVLVRAGPRDVEDHVFVEPSTGQLFPVTDAPYEAVDSVVNNKNCWVNMQPRTAAPSSSRAGMGPVAFDLENNDNWEYVFIQPGGRRSANGGEGKDGHADGDGGKEDGDMELAAALQNGMNLGGSGAGGAGGSGSGLGAGGLGGDATGAANGGDGGDDEGPHILDLPPSWVSKLEVPRDTFEQRYGELECSVTLFHKAKLELYAPDSHPRGLTARLFKYRDLERTLLVEEVELFEKRADKLRKRVRRPLERRVDEYFDSGRDHHLKRHSEVMGKWRELEFYATAHIEGLVRRTEVIGSKIVEVFKDRVDHLVYRSVSLLPRGADATAMRGGRKPATKMGQFVLQVEPGDLPMRKMTQKFARNRDVDADADVAKRTYFVQDKTIREDFHYAEGRIMASSRLYHKDAPDGQHVELRFVSPFAQTPKPSELDADFRRVVALEKECSHAIREATRVAGEIMWSRSQDELAIDIEKTIFDTAREKAAEEASKEAEEEEKKEQAADSKADILRPFLVRCVDPDHPTREEAQHADRECRKALKERLIERVNIIQRRLDEENAKLAKRQAAFQRSQREQLGEGAEEEFEQFCAEAMFKIGILEQRLQRQEETVLAKFTELEIALKKDPRLAVLYGGGK